MYRCCHFFNQNLAFIDTCHLHLRCLLLYQAYVCICSVVCVFVYTCIHPVTRTEHGLLNFESTGARDVPSLSVQCKVTLFLPELDAMLSELDRRFSDKNIVHMRAIQTCAPGSLHLPIILLLLLILTALMKVLFPWSAKHTVNGKELDNSDVLRELSPLRTAFPADSINNCCKHCTL